MKIGKRLLLACILVVVVLVIVRIEDKGLIGSNIRAVVSSSEDVVLLQKMVKKAFEGEEEKIIVSSAVHSQRLLEFVSEQPYDDGYLLTFEEAPVIEALQDGYVVFTGHTKATGKTMTIHYGNIAITYGQLDAFNQLPYSTVLAGEVLAYKGTDSPLFLRVEVDGQALKLEDILPLLREWEVR